MPYKQDCQKTHIEPGIELFYCIINVYEEWLGYAIFVKSDKKALTEKKISIQSTRSFRSWRHRLVVRTQDSHSCNRGSIPLGAAKRRRVYPKGIVVSFFDRVEKGSEPGFDVADSATRRKIPLGAAKRKFP